MNNLECGISHETTTETASDSMWKNRSTFGLTGAQMDRLMVDLAYNFDMDVLEVATATGETVENFVLFDHPVRQDDRLLKFQESLAKEDFPVVVNYEALHHLFEVYLLGHIARSLGIALPVSKKDVIQFKEEHLTKNAEFPLKCGNSQAIVVCDVNPIPVGNKTLYERRYRIRSAT